MTGTTRAGTGPPETERLAATPDSEPIQKSDERRNPATDFPQSIASRQVSWWTVHEFVTPLLERVGSWPMVGTPAWCALDDSDPAKLAAIFDAATHWALRLDTAQEASCEASQAISEAEDWAAVGRSNQQRADFYADKPWLRRVVA